jgi:2,3-bisphosphoglycerate-independent phosphoglycerate mutase
MMNKKKYFIIFIDGLGIGKNNKTINPVSHIKNSIFYNFNQINRKYIKDNTLIIPINANLLKNQIPQSATCQSSLFTGINTAKLNGRHIPGFPNKHIRKIVFENNIFLKFKEKGLKTNFINCYPINYKELNKTKLSIDNEGNFIYQSEISKRLLKKISVTTIISLSLKKKFIGINGLKKEKTIYHDFTNKSLIKNSFQINKFSPAKASKILYNQKNIYDVILYEYFLLDIAGHKTDFRKAVKYLKELSEFINCLIKKLKKNETLILISDHGNIEDISKKSHTFNPVPLIIINYENLNYKNTIKSLTDFIKLFNF